MLSIFEGIDAILPQKDISVDCLTLDSRNVKEGSLFIALKGNKLNGEDFIESALQLGAKAVAVDSCSYASNKDNWKNIKEKFEAGFVLVNDLKRSVSKVAANFYDDPSRAMNLIGVTGTNGKSSVVSFISQIVRKHRFLSATVGTLGYGIEGEELITTKMTTPSAIDCQRILCELNSANVRYVSMEVSSHAIDQSRIDHIAFDIVLLTNITRDHLDYHGSFEEYSKTKKQFIDLNFHAIAIVNYDDIECKRYFDSNVTSDRKLLSYSTYDEKADVFAKDVTFKPNGISATIVSPWGKVSIFLKMIGEFNLSNALASVAACCSLGLNFESVCSSLEEIQSVKGRLQRVFSEIESSSEEPKVFIDYAHTPNALENALRAIEKHSDGELWVVFGCGGDRDRGKRADMGAVAFRYADHVVLTSDNSRTEQTKDIVNEILTGVDHNNNFVIVEDRAKAINVAVKSASPNDVVLIAGKGHEEYQECNGVTIPFSDFDEAKDALMLRSKETTGLKS